MNAVLHLLRAFAVLVLLALPASAQEAQPSGTISTTQDSRGDIAIDRRIEAIIAQLSGYEGVTVEVREGIVTFSGEVLDAEAIPRLDALAARVDGVVAIENEVVESTDVARRLNPVAERFRARTTQFVNYLPLLAIAVLAGAVVMLLGILLTRWDKPWDRIAPNAFIADIYRMVLRLVFVVAGVVTALDILNATAVLTGLLGAAGIVGLAVGFAVRDTVENFIASVMLSLRQPFRPNDLVDIEGSHGTVIRLTSRATILLDPDGNHVRLPNAVVFKAKIVNFTRNDERRFSFVLGVDPVSDVAEAKRIGMETLTSLDFVLDSPPPQVWISDAGASTIDVEFLGWINQREANFNVARSEAIRMVMGALTRADIGLPEPTYRVSLVGSGAVPAAPPADAARPPSATPLARAEPPDAADVSPDRAIERKVAEERRATVDDDLLSPEAPVE